MNENDLHEEKQGSVSANQKPRIAPLLNIGYLLFDTLEFLLAPRAMLRSIEEEYDQQSYNSGEDVKQQ